MSSSRYPKRKRTTDERDSRAGHVVRKTGSQQFHLRGKRLLPAVVQQLGSNSKDKAWIKIAKEGTVAAGYEDITYGILSNAVNRTALWLRDNIGSNRERVYAYLGPSDARYLLLMIAAAKLHCCMFLPSPHNAIETQRQLLKDTESVVLLHDPPGAEKAAEIVEGTGIRVCKIPNLADLLDKKPVDDVAYDVTYASEKGKPWVILHTSGTTDVPKPIAIPHGYYAYEDLSRTDQYRDAITSTPFEEGSICLVTAPLWHAGGMFFGLLKPLLHSVVAVLPPSGLPVTADLVQSCLEFSKAKILQVAPSVAAELAIEPRHTAALRDLTSIIIGSGPLSESAGNKLLKINANTLHYFGATETDLLPLLRLDDPAKDWQYHRFHPLSGARFEPQGAGLFELVIEKLSGAAQPCFEVFPNARTHATKDVFSQHSAKHDQWKFEGRIDDVITFSSGEKMSPTTFENAVTAFPGISGALMVGTGRVRPALLIEMDESIPEKDAVDTIWSKVQDANSGLPSFGRVIKSMIFTTRQPFVRTPKGTVQRHDCEERFRSQIDDLYDTYEAKSQDQPALGITTSETDVLAFVSSAHAAASESTIHPDTDIFASSMDSMKVAEMVHTLNSGLSKSRDPAARIVRLFAGHLYTHRSLAGISRALHGKIDRAKNEMDRGPAMKHEAALHRHLTRLPQELSARVLREKMVSPLECVVLTGSTGALGTHLLHALLHNDESKYVYCLDRSDSAEDAYLDTFPMDARLLAKVTFFQIKTLEQAGFALAEHAYRQLCDEVTTVLHNAWPVNFQLPLTSSDRLKESTETLDPHVGGIATLVNFAADAKKHPRIVFISSLAAVLRCESNVPEAIVDDTSAPERSGYAQSKWMGEQLLQAATRTNAIRSPIIVRPGQIAGPLPHAEVVKGSGSTWHVSQAVPSLVLSSAAIGALPHSLGEKNKLRWVPVDICAQAILEIAKVSERPEVQVDVDVYNLTNLASAGKELTWTEDLLPLIQKRLQAVTTDRELEILSLPKWYERMLAHGPRRENPAFKLLDFFGDLVTSDEHAGLGTNVDIGKAKAASLTFRGLGPVQVQWMEHWMTGWGL